MAMKTKDSQKEKKRKHLKNHRVYQISCALCYGPQVKHQGKVLQEHFICLFRALICSPLILSLVKKAFLSSNFSMNQKIRAMKILPPVQNQLDNLKIALIIEQG
uniref:Uncharacterized protein n=1 Tax=Oryza glaberrima TaxID=4538 RepID=I1R1G9_ORYGL